MKHASDVESEIGMILRKSAWALVVSLLALLMTACSGAGSGQPYAEALPTLLAIAPATTAQPVGVSQQFTATVTFSDNTNRDVTSQVAWASSSEAIAAITRSGGLGTAVAPGDVVISASFSAAGRTVTASATLRVTPAEIRSIEVTPASGNLELGANQQFTATAKLTDGTTQDVTRNASWTTSDPTVLRVNMSSGRVGLANTRGPGAATVIATFDRTSGSTVVTVVRRITKFLYVGGVFGIAGYTVTPATGELTPIAGARFTPAAAVLSMTVSRDRRFLYAADIGLGVIWGFQIDPSGSLTPLPGGPIVTPTILDPLSIVAHPTADFLFMSDVGTGEITTFRIGSDGSLTAVTPTTQTSQQALFATVTPDGRFFYQALRLAGVATIPGFSIASDGALLAIPGDAAATGNQPRTLTVDPSGRFLYVTIPSSSAGLSTAVFGYAIEALTGALTPLPGSPYSAGESPIGGAADASGRFLYVANLANSTSGNSLSGFAIDATTGVLTSLPRSPFPAPFSPVSVAVDPGAQYVYVGLDGSQGVRAFAIDQQSGALNEISGSPFPAPGPSLALTLTY